MTLCHILVLTHNPADDSRRYLQVTDTPGLLARADEDRNAMENLTLACLAHLPTSVLFVMDLTGECGTSLENQWAIRQYLKVQCLWSIRSVPSCFQMA
jgi:GTP1/Obg family GTP-binding protein